MALLTTSQLTFYDLKDAYHVEINPDCIVINCDEKGISKEETNVDISYGIYCGSTRIPGTAEVINFEINGSQVAITDCNVTDDGHVQFVIPKNINLTDIDSVYVQFKEQNVSDTEDFTFDKYIQLIKVTDGASGTGLVFKIYSEDGTVFREDMSQINLETVLFIGESRVDLDKTEYKWEYDSGSGNWISLGDGSTLTVEKPTSDNTVKWAFKTIRCTVNYNGNTYADYISLTNDINIYTSEIKYFNGTNVMRTSDQYIVAYMALYKNGEEVDLLPANKFASAQSIDEYNIITTDAIKEDNSQYGSDDIGAVLYFILKDSQRINIYNIILGQFDGNVWRKVEPRDVLAQPYEFIYENSKAYNNLTRSISNEANKIMIVSKEEILKKLEIGFKACKQNGVIVSEASDIIIDTNDPFVCPYDPFNNEDNPQDPINGSIWINTGISPYVVKICQLNQDGTYDWVDSTEVKSKIHTSKPSSYSINDVWILNEGETCSYSVDMTEVIELPPEFTKLKYIESTGTQYIDTGVIPNQDTLISMEVELDNVGTTITPLFGARVSTTSSVFGMWFLPSAIYPHYGNTSYNAHTININTVQRLNITMGNLTATVNNNIQTLTDAGTFSSNYSMTLFAFNDGGNIDSRIPRAKLYSCKIYDKNVLIRNFIPCLNDNNIAGLYDTVHNIFYDNDGTGEFIGYNNKELPDGYTQLEYIESNGTQYIDTNYIPTTDNLKIDTKFMYTSINPWKALCGSGNASDTQWSLIPITNSSSRFTFYTGTSSQLDSLPIESDKVYKLSVYTKNNTLSYALNEISGSNTFNGSIYKENSIYVFTHHSGNSSLTTSLACSARIYDFKIYDNDVLVRDFVPCRNSNGNIGLYDIANNVFYPNIGTGNFIDGSEIINKNENIVYYEYGPGSMLRSSSSRTEEEGFVESDWSDTDPQLTEMRNNIAQYFQFHADTGLTIGQQDQKFYVNITSTEMGFYDNTDNSPKKVVSIGNQSAIIKNLTVEEGTSFNCNSQANFNNDIHMYNPYKETQVGFVWKIEPNGSLSLVVI